MTTRRNIIEVQGVTVEIVRKDIKNLHITVHPPDGKVRVSAPLRLDDNDVQLAIVSRLGWIRRQQAGFYAQARQSMREMVSGESHYVEGRRYRLDVIERDGPPSVRVRNNNILELCVRPGTDRDKREEILHRWYRVRLKERIPALIAKWEPVIGVTVSEWGIKRMKTRWGTCSIEAQRIWINLELAKKSPECLEYIVVHEMTHLLESTHNSRFIGLMDRFMPKWRFYRDELNRLPVRHEEWGY